MGDGSRPRVSVAQLGARRHYLVPRALREGGHLEHFYTDVYFGRRAWLDPALAAMLGRRGASFRGRQEASIPASLVTDFPRLAIATMTDRASPCRRWITSGRQFAQSVVRRGFGEANALVAFSSAALEMFEVVHTLGLVKILDHATAPRDVEMMAVAGEEQRFPGWAAEPALQDSALAEYADRQREERRLADRILCGSTFVATELGSRSEADRAKVRVVPLGIAPHPGWADRVVGRRKGELRVLFVGNEGLRKGLGYLLAAVAQLKTSRIRLRVAGSPGFSPLGMSEVRRHCEDCRPLPRDEMRTWYEWADVLVLPSISDTFGIVILEAMSAGLPVVASVASGGPDVIRDGVDGWIVPLRDSNAIADRLDRLASNELLAEEMGMAAMTRAAAFGLDAYRTRLLEAIAS